MPFITIVSQGREVLFGQIVDGKMELNDAGKMVGQVWDNLPNRFPMMKSDSFVIMPNHIHGIVVLNNDANGVGARPRVRPGINDNDNSNDDIQLNEKCPGMNDNDQHLNHRDVSFKLIDCPIINNGDTSNVRAGTRPAPTDRGT